MNSIKRQTIFTIFAVFFIILLPFIVIFSLGYGIDFKKGSVSNNLTVKVQTFPRNSNIFVGENKFETPAELSIPAGQQTKLRIENENFFTENFEVASKLNENSTARIEGLWLLPKNPESEFTTNKIINVLDKNYLLLEKDDKYGVANYAFAGIRDEFIEINNPENIKVQPGSWQPLLQNIFWEQTQNLILYQKNSSQWELLNLKSFPNNFVSIVGLDKNQLIVLDSEKNLWLLNLSNKTLTFAENNITGLSFTQSPDMIWLLQSDTIFRLERISLDPLNINFVNNKFSSSKSILLANQVVIPENLNNFVTKNLFLGLVFKIGNTAIYIPDSNKESYKILTNDLKSIGTSGSTIFWLDKENNIHTYNLLINQERLINIPDLNLESDSEIVLSYYSNWKRLFVYTKKQVVAVWIDFDINNDSILFYSPFNWIEDQNCLSVINSNYQFCSKENKLFVYKNNSFPFQ